MRERFPVFERRPMGQERQRERRELTMRETRPVRRELAVRHARPIHEERSIRER